MSKSLTIGARWKSAFAKRILVLFRREDLCICIPKLLNLMLAVTGTGSLNIGMIMEWNMETSGMQLETFCHNDILEKIDVIIWDSNSITDNI